MNATTLNTWVIALLRMLDASGIDSRVLVERAGLDPDRMNEPNTRSPVSATARLWKLAVEATGDPCLALKVVRYVQPATFHSLGLALLSSRNLEDVLYRTARFSSIVSDGLELRVEPAVGGIKQVVHWRAEVPVIVESIDLMMASTIKMGMLILGVDPMEPRPIEIRLRRAATPAMRKEFQAYFRCTLQFEAEEDSLWIPEAWLARPLPMANQELARQSDLAVMDYLSRFERETFAEKVRAEMIFRLTAGEPSRSEVAKALCLSEKTLQRRLREENTTYLEVLEEVRRDLAGRYLRDGTIPLSEIAFRLGFFDQSTFTRPSGAGRA